MMPVLALCSSATDVLEAFSSFFFLNLLASIPMFKRSVHDPPEAADSSDKFVWVIESPDTPKTDATDQSERDRGGVYRVLWRYLGSPNTNHRIPRHFSH